MVSVDFSSANTKDDIAEKCMMLLTTSFMNFFPEQVEKFIEDEHYQNYTIIFEDSKILFVKYNNRNPSLFDLSASQIAHYLFPDNFAKYQFVIEPNMHVESEISAGYLYFLLVKILSVIQII